MLFCPLNLLGQGLQPEQHAQACLGYIYIYIQCQQADRRIIILILLSFFKPFSYFINESTYITLNLINNLILITLNWHESIVVSII